MRGIVILFKLCVTVRSILLLSPFCKRLGLETEKFSSGLRPQAGRRQEWQVEPGCANPMA